MSVSPPTITQPIFIIGTQYAAPLSFFDTTGAPIADPPAGLTVAADNAAVSASISGSNLLASISTAGITSVLTVSAVNSAGAVIAATVTISDGPLPVVLGSISVGQFAPVAPAA